MRQLRYTRPGLELTTVDEPSIGADDDVKVRVEYASVCGTDLHILRGDFDDVLPVGAVPLGHEASGTVVELGSGATTKGLRVGDPVTFYFNRYCGACHHCRNGQEQFCTAVAVTNGFMSDYVVLDEQQVFPLAASMPLLAASLVEPTSVALRGTDLGRIRPGASVAVIGGGGIGQIAARLASRAGAVDLTLFEPVGSKRSVGISGGAEHTIDPIGEDPVARAMKVTGGLGFDVVIETSGAPVACRTAMEIAARGATVVFLATYAPGSTYELSLGRAFMQEITLVTGVYQSPYLFPRSIAIHGRLGLDELITVFTPEDHEAAFEAQRTGTAVKAVFDFAADRGDFAADRRAVTTDRRDVATVAGDFATVPGKDHDHD